MDETKRILAVDDEANNLSALRRLFIDDDDVLLEFANSGEMALKKAASFKPDVILLDILMPGIDGYEVCRTLKQTADTSTIMVLLLSGKTEVEDRMKGYDAKADDYITKPYDADELKAKVTILLRLKHAQDSLREMNKNLEHMVQERTRELVQSEQQALVGRMVHGIVHNLKGPFSGVKGFVELTKLYLQDSLKAAQEASPELVENLANIDNYLDLCQQSCHTMEEMINDLLHKGRQDASVTKMALDLNEILQGDLDFLQANLEFKHKVTKKLQLSKQLPTVLGVASDFSQIFCNLIQNAVDAMHETAPKILTISSEHKNDAIFFHFQDSGPGIAEDLKEKIFEPFFSTKKRRDEVAQGESFGTGLGLYTCAEILRPYGGSISVENHGGACFSIKIPVVSDPT